MLRLIDFCIKFKISRILLCILGQQDVEWVRAQMNKGLTAQQWKQRYAKEKEKNTNGKKTIERLEEESKLSLAQSELASLKGIRRLSCSMSSYHDIGSPK